MVPHPHRISFTSWCLSYTFKRLLDCAVRPAASTVHDGTSGSHVPLSLPCSSPVFCEVLCPWAWHCVNPRTSIALQPCNQERQGSCPEQVSVLVEINTCPTWREGSHLDNLPSCGWLSLRFGCSAKGSAAASAALLLNIWQHQ